MIFCIIFFPWNNNQDKIVINEIVENTVISPKNVQYISMILTNNRKDSAASAIEDIYVLNPDIRDIQVALLDQRLIEINLIRINKVTALSAKESEINELTLTDLSIDSVNQILNMKDEQWQTIAMAAKNSLTRILTSSLTLQETLVIKNNLNNYIDPAFSNMENQLISQLIFLLIQPNLIVDQDRTNLLKDQARAMQPLESITVNKGDVILSKGSLITAQDYEMLNQIGLLNQSLDFVALLTIFSKSLLLTLVTSLFLYFLKPNSLASFKKIFLFSMLLILPILLIEIFYLNFFNDNSIYFFYLLPIIAFPMVALVLTDFSVAMLLTSLIAIVIATISLDSWNTSLFLNNNVELSQSWMTFFVSSLTAIIILRRADRQQQYIYAAAVSSSASILCSFIFWINQSILSSFDFLLIVISTISGSIFSAILALGLVNILSVFFGIVTRVKLMELAQLDNPLLRKLQDEAPGTFQHSLLVGTLVERAADRINADSLLARVGAYYHDIGKLISPSFFVENTSDKSPHDSLDPIQSTRVIHQHVTAGIETARKANLPDIIIQFIQQHHGTRLASFFYRIAAEENPSIDIELFRYPGPKPQSKEVALVMLADSAEAAVRASKDHSTEAILSIVNEVIKERFDEDQFDECDLSIKQIRIAGDSIASALTAVVHPRVNYPGPSKQELIDRGIHLDENLENIKEDQKEDGPQLSLGSIEKSDDIN